MASKISRQELHQQIITGSAPSVVDVRSAAEFAIGHVPGAVNIPMEQVESRLADLPGSRLVLVCEAGKRAEVVAGWLGDSRELSLLEGGTKAWREAGYPVVGCAPCRWTIERQVRLIAGLVVLVATLLSVFVNPGWVFLAMFIGAGLTFAGATNICGMGLLLAKMPWNASAKTDTRRQSSIAGDCCT